MKTKLRLFTLLLLLLCGGRAHALSFSLDSISEMGRFPRFCVNTYYWADRFFNGYDTAYVVGSGYKFNVKLVSDNWFDYYEFELPNDVVMRMNSGFTSTIGAKLTYMALSLGYDKNVSRFFGNPNKAKQNYTLGFNCSLFAFNLTYTINDVPTTITHFGVRRDKYNPHLPFSGINIKTLQSDLFYFFNHKKYSQGAAFSYGRIQTRSQGSWFAGIVYSRNSYNFDFRSLPDEMKAELPPNWTNHTYNAKTHNTSLKFGYGYNWVFTKHWVLGVTEAPIIGVRRGFVNSEMKKTSLAFANQFKLSVVWNNKHWFAGLVYNQDIDIIYTKNNTFTAANPTFTATLGYRFNLW